MLEGRQGPGRDAAAAISGDTDFYWSGGATTGRQTKEPELQHIAYHGGNGWKSHGNHWKGIGRPWKDLNELGWLVEILVDIRSC